jgi:hypothetical protein
MRTLAIPTTLICIELLVHPVIAQTAPVTVEKLPPR